MLELRKQGWSYSALGRRYGKDHTTILYHCEKANVAPEVPVVIQKTFKNEKIINVAIEPKEKEIPKPPPKPDKYANIISPKEKKLRSYASYLKEALRRPIERHYFNTERLVD